MPGAHNSPSHYLALLFSCSLPLLLSANVALPSLCEPLFCWPAGERRMCEGEEAGVSCHASRVCSKPMPRMF